MRVVLLSTSYPRHEGDPSGHFVETEAIELSRQGYDVHVIAPGARGRSGSPLSAGVTVWGAGGESLFGHPGALERAQENPLRLVDLVGFLPRARNLLRALEPLERTIAHFVVPNGYPLALGGSSALDVVLHGSDARLVAHLPSLVRHRITQSLLARGARFRFVAEGLRREFLAALGETQRERVRAVSRVEPAPISIPAASARVDWGERRMTRGPSERASWVSCGRLIASKRVDRALREAARHGAELTVVGDGPLRRDLERLARTLEPRARFVGQVSRHEALAWIARADKLVHLSEAEGAPTVIREARALGVPVLATPVGDVAEWAREDPGIEIYR